MKKQISFIIACLCISFASAQTWQDMIRQGASYNDVIEEAERYLLDEGKADRHSKKAFMRWREMASYRISGNGELINYSARNVRALKGIRTQHEGATQSRSTHGQWTEVGPFDFTPGSSGQGGVGRINNVTIDPADSDNIWASSPSGALWRSTDNGTNWTQIWEATNDGQPWSWRHQEIDLSAYIHILQS